MPKHNKKFFCQDCGSSSFLHIKSWLDELTKLFIPSIPLPRKIDQFLDLCLEKIFTFLGLASLEDNFTESDIQLRSMCFIKEAKKRGVQFRVLRTPFGIPTIFKQK